MAMILQQRMAKPRTRSLALAWATCLLVFHGGVTSSAFAKGSFMAGPHTEPISGWIELACSNQAPVNLTLRIVESKNVVTYEMRLQFGAFERAKKTSINIDDGGLTIARTANTDGVDNTKSVAGRVRILKLDVQGAGLALVAFAPGDDSLHRYRVDVKTPNCP